MSIFLLNILLIVAIAWSLSLIWSRYGVFSIAGISGIGFAIYSMPAMLGIMVTPVSSGNYFEPTSAKVTLLIALAWVVYAATLIIKADQRSPPFGGMLVHGQGDDEQAKLTATLAVCSSLALYLLASYITSPLFFLMDRYYVESTMPGLLALWRWCIAIGLVCSVLSRQRLLIAANSVLVVIVFIAGDRTLLYVVVFALLVAVFGRVPLVNILRRPYIIPSVAAAGLVVLFGKPIYLAIKTGSSAVLWDFFYRHPAALFSGFEPFLVHGHLETVVFYDWAFPIWDVVVAVIAQLLIVPSAFGVETNQFNTAFTRTFFPNVDYGLAYSYWAQGYSVGGTLGVAVFAFLFGGIVKIFDHLDRVSSPSVRSVILVAGAVFATYIFRNSLENIFAFLRQIAIVGILILLGGWMLNGRRLANPAALRESAKLS